MARFSNKTAVPHLAFCTTHGKKAFTKNNAKKLLHVLPKRAGTSRYPCTMIFEAWHVGHLPRSVREGRESRHEVFRDAA